MTAISANLGCNCVMVGTQVECWGFNSNGQLGNGTLNDSGTPLVVPL